MADKEWRTDPIPKFGDVVPLSERLKRHLPSKPPRQYETTPEITMRREADQKFRVKKVD